MAEQLDVFTAVYRAVWAALVAYAPFTALVALRNRVDMTADDFEQFAPNTPPDALPEVALIQSAWSQSAFTFGNAQCTRTQTFALVVTTGKLNPVQMNRVKEAVLDALIDKGQTLGLTVAVNGNKITGWSVSGEDSLTPIEATPGQDRTEIRSQSVGRITVNLVKSVPRRTI